jgi:hypothetical protein
LTEKSFPKAVTASPEFTSLAKAFLSEIAPNFKCSVCESRDFLIVERLSSEYRPTIDFYSVKSSNWKDLFAWLCICDHCGNTYTFTHWRLRQWQNRALKDVASP